MYNLFDNASRHTTGIMRDSKWMYLKPCLQRNIDTVIQYYRRSPIAVKSQHFLIKLLGALTVPHSQEITRYYDNVQAIALNVGMTLGMTSPISKGKIFDGVFYGHGNSEILIADNAEFDPEAANANWENLEPIRVLRHPRSDLNLNIPNGINTGVEEGLAVILINIPMLAIQYRAFRRDQYEKAFRSGSNEMSINQFLHMYPLTNMIRSHADYALFNRIHNLLRHLPMGVATVKHSFYLMNYNKELDLFHRRTIEALKGTEENFVDTLRSVLLVSDENMLQFIDFPDIVETRQVVWGLTIAILPVLTFLFRLTKESAQTRNGVEMNQIRRRLLQQRTENLMKTMLVGHVSEQMDVENEIRYLMSLQ